MISRILKTKQEYRLIKSHPAISVTSIYEYAFCLLNRIVFVTAIMYFYDVLQLKPGDKRKINNTHIINPSYHNQEKRFVKKNI